MAIEKKAAGEARQRPRPAPAPYQKAPLSGEAKPHARPAGIAPTFDVQARQTVARGGPHKGMISNPWVKHWSGQGPAPEMREMPLAKGAGAARGASGEAARDAVSATKAVPSTKAAGEASVKGRTDAAPKPGRQGKKKPRR
jgi:hypothetical protein